MSTHHSASPARRNPLPILQSNSGPAWSRLSLMELGNLALVMDRGNGRWVFIESGQVPLVKLLLADADLLPDAVRTGRDKLAGELLLAGLGKDVYQSSGGLNTLILKLTNACNYACTYCYDFETDERATRLDFETAIAAIRESLEIAPQFLHVILHGGEPTLVFPLLKQIVLAGEDAASQIGKRIEFSGQTNLSRITQEIVDFTKEHSIHWGISLDGPPDLNDRFRVLRSGEGTHSYFTQALSEFPEFVRQFGVMTVITGATDSHLLKIARYVREQGVAFLGLVPLSDNWARPPYFRPT